MLILPIVNRNRVLNVAIKLKNAFKVKSGVRLSGLSESDIVVDGRKFSESIYKDDPKDTAVLEFIRNNSLRSRKNFLVMTREASDSMMYDVYEVKLPNEKVTDGLDSLYTSAITDLRKEIPGTSKGRYVSFEKLGVGEHLSDERMKRFERVIQDYKNSDQRMMVVQEAGFGDFLGTLDFMKQFDCTVVEESTIPEESLRDVLDSLQKLNTRDSRNLSNYYGMALENRDLYAKMSYINKMVYGKPLNLIQSKRQKEKQFVKQYSDSLGDANGHAA